MNPVMENVEPVEKTAEEKKKNRRRSSIGSEILNAFMGAQSEETMSPLEVRVRPKRAVQMRIAPAPAPVNVVQRKKPVRYSFEIGERADVKSCLKHTTGPILVNKRGPVSKSLARIAAEKISQKYRKRRSSSTPVERKTVSRLKFAKICSIRVISPRQGYDPEKLEMPNSDDEADELNPNRQRLSTVQLRLTPTSMAQLESLQNQEVVQFNAEMVFGDGEPTRSSSEDNTETAVESSSSETSLKMVKKKVSRRKSLIVGAASPLKMPTELVLEKARLDEDLVAEEISAPKRKPRKSLRLNVDSEQSSSNEVLVETVPEEKKVVQEKKTRRKSCLIAPSSSSTVPVPEASQKKEDNKISNFFSPRSKVPDEKVEEKKRKRRSQRFVVEEPSDSQAGTSSATISEPVAKVAKEEEPKTENVKIPSMFLKSPKPDLKKTSDAVQKEVVETSSPAPKMFSLFSPKPKPKLTADVVDLTENSPIVEHVKKRESLFGVKREKHWGDVHPDLYHFMTNTPQLESIFPLDSSDATDSDLFKPRAFDASILSIDPKDDRIRLRSPDGDEHDAVELVLNGELTASDKLPKEMPEQEGKPPMEAYPNSMDWLVEGADEEQTVRGWLRKWKKRVRKEAEIEMKKDSKEKKRGRRRKGEDEEDSDEEFQLDERGQRLDNPLVIIGPTGVGKTALIRAVSMQENMKMISMGPESDRTGVEIKKKLQEAVRSHRVGQQPSRMAMLFNTISSCEYESKVRAPTVLDKEFQQSLVVFEHVDVFFDTVDRHGVRALLEVVNEAAVPVVFTCEREWPRDGLESTPLEIRMVRREKRTQRYVQKLIYWCSKVFINNSTIRKLSESVNHDLNGLIHLAHFYSLAPSRPFPISSRHSISTGFDNDWEENLLKRTRSAKDDRVEELIDEYSKVLPDGIIDMGHPRMSRHWDTEQREFAAGRAGYERKVHTAFEALNGRYSKRELVQDVLPQLVMMDETEKRRKQQSRRHLHHFLTLSDLPTDGDALLAAVGGWKWNTQ